MDGFASFRVLFVEESGVGVVDDTSQKFAESGKLLFVQTVKHMRCRAG